MKMTPLTAALAISVGVSAVSTGTAAKTAAPEHTSHAVAGTRPERLGPEYKRIRLFVDFRNKLLQDGWSPVKNPECMEAVLGDDYEDLCRKMPDFISCRLCEMVPETFRHTIDGYNLMRYQKRGVILGVSVYGDIRALLEPKYELVVTGWHYDGSINVIQLDVAEDPSVDN